MFFLKLCGGSGYLIDIPLCAELAELTELTEFGSGPVLDLVVLRGCARGADCPGLRTFRAA